MIIAVIVILCQAVIANGDVAPDPNELRSCARRQVGDRCYANGPGICESSECCHNDYTDGIPPNFVCEPCTRCIPTAGSGDAGRSTWYIPPFSWAQGLVLASGLLLAAALARQR